MPFFSVVIPLYNKQNYIAATLQSVVKQTFADFEVIVVNDVSTDNSFTVAQQIKDKRIRHINHDTNGGLSASRNTGIRTAKADYIAFLDADDIWMPQFLERIHKLISNYPTAAIFATKYDELHREGIVIEHPFVTKNGIVSDFFDQEKQQHIYCYSSVCFRKIVFEKAGYFDEQINMGEDVDFNIRANLMFDLAYLPEPLARITMYSENQITHSSLRSKVIVDHDKYERENPDNKELKRYLDFHRYTMAKRYKMAGETDTFRALKNAINPANLNWKQRLLLMAPAFVLRSVKTAKTFLAKKGYNPTTY